MLFPQLPLAKKVPQISSEKSIPAPVSHLIFAVLSIAQLRLLFFACLCFVALTPVQARLGETLNQIKARYGKPEQQAQPRKDQAVWLFEADDGQLVYSVTFDAKGHSIAEGLRPIKRAVFTADIAQDFIQGQIALFRDSKTIRTHKPGEKYQFAGQVFTCGEQEIAIVDEANGVMIVWVQKGVPSVMAVAPAMVQQTH